mmetsp:Transcript_85022/g.147525  ORF Transcript_85022/g.147525 Transcript_85022/m.147525 type:complete len:133 (+) Transcript_85022:80-478(+)
MAPKRDRSRSPKGASAERWNKEFKKGMKITFLGTSMGFDLSQKYSGVNNCFTRIVAGLNEKEVKWNEVQEDYKKHEVNKKNQGLIDKADFLVGSKEKSPKEFVDYATEHGKEIVEWEDFLIALGEAGIDLKK